jgi:hypothetical protein
MRITITESQYKKLIVENLSKESVSNLKSLQRFFQTVSEETKKQIGLDLGFLSTWGVSIAGFVKPVSDFMEGKYPSLSGSDLALLSTGIILTYYTSNKEKLKMVLEKIKEKLLIQEFDFMLGKCELLKRTFFNFIDSLALPFAKMSNMLAYTFLIPIIPQLYEMAQGYGETEISDIVKRIIMFVSISLAGNFAKRIIYSIVKRFKS